MVPRVLRRAGRRQVGPHVRTSRFTSGAIAVLLAAGLVGCSPAPAPTPSQSVAAPSPSASGTISYAPRIRIGIVSPGVHGFDLDVVPLLLSNERNDFDSPDSRLIERFLFNGIYRTDARLAPTPDLAARPCTVSADALTVTCTLRDAMFSNGTPVTADDVVFTYDLARSEPCPFDPQCLKETLESATALDPHTVRFQLATRSPAFITINLAGLWIDSKAVVEGAFEAFHAKASAVGLARIRKAADIVNAELEKKTPDCDRVRTENEPLVKAAGLELPPVDAFNIAPGAKFDSCRYAGEIGFYLGTAADSLDASGIDAVAIAYPILRVNQHPVGSGSWMVDENASAPGRRLVLQPNPYSFRGPPATREIDFEIFPSRRDAADALEGGQIDWLSVPSRTGDLQGGAELYRLIRQFAGVTFAQYPDPGGNERIEYNVRPGQIFEDGNLRKALELCIDKSKLVESATDGQGVAAYGALSTGGWPGNTDLPRPKRDVEAARRLMEASGWRQAAPGAVFEKGDRKLEAKIWQNGREDRLKLVQLIGLQAADCGMAISAATYQNQRPFFFWPLIPDGEKRPFDAILWGVFGPLEPDFAVPEYETSHIVTKANSPGENYLGYSDPLVDELIQKGRETYDLDSRRSTYQELEGRLADSGPLLVLWARLERVALRTGLTSVDGPLLLDEPGWDWQLEKIVLPVESTGP